MCAAALIEHAAAGRLPVWAEAGPERRAHLARVARLMDTWAAALGLAPAERARWRAAAWLHDALKDGSPETLRPLVPAPLRELPGGVLHGPAAASRIQADGLDDAPLLQAISWHTLGHPEFDRLGRALYLADWLEPGRAHWPAWRAALRARMPAAFDAVLAEVTEARLARLLWSRRSIRPESVAFWNSVIENCRARTSRVTVRRSLAENG